MWDFAIDTMPANDIKLYAQWGVDTYDVTFDVNGGESSNPSNQIVGFGKLISEPSTPVKTGYSFTGWNTSLDGSGSMWNFATDSMPEEDVELYAQWEINEYALSFDTTGAVTQAPSARKLKFGEFTSKPGDPIKTGYEFDEWNTTPTGEGVTADFESMSMPAKDVDLYATWTVDVPVIDPLVPGDICMTGSNGVPGATVVITDVHGNTIGTAVVDANGDWEFCDEIVTDEDDIKISQIDPNGNTSETVEVNKPNSWFNVFFNTNGATSNNPDTQRVKIGKYVLQPSEPVKL
jgi:uncharacterized repeat protein (TIGR02543 family)